MAVVGTLSGGCCWCNCWRLACVGFVVGWCLVGVDIDLVWVLCERITLSVQNLMCDSCRWVAVEGGSVEALSGVWHGCGLRVGLCGWFGLRWWALVG